MKKLPENRWISLWRHFYERERTADELTGSMIEWQEKWGWDLLKLNPAACYHALDFGTEYEFYSDGVSEPKLVRPAIVQGQDVYSLERPDVSTGALGEQLKVISNLRRHFGPNLPIVQTIFSPMEIAHRLMTEREALQHMRKEAPRELHALLQLITATFSEYAVRCLDAGADGIFFATKWATSELLSWKEYLEFGKQYDLAFLEPLRRKDALVILHVCGSNTYMQNMLDYSPDIFSYDFFAEGALLPHEVYDRTGKFVLGGIDPERIESDPEGVGRGCQRYGDLPGWLAGPSCVVPVNVSDGSIRKLKESLPR